MSRKIVILSMLKNEMDILPMWLEFHKNCADHFYLIDHRSDDGSYEYLKNQEQKSDCIKVFSYEHKGYFQKEVLTKMSQRIHEEVGDCWILPLDVDEFVDGSHPTEFKSFCLSLGAEQVIKLPWINNIPLVVKERGSVEALDVYLHSKKWDLNHGKMMFKSELTQRPDFHVMQGAHGICVNGFLWQESHLQWPINHIPIRSELQFLIKIFQGTYSYLQMNADKKKSKNLGFHWFEMADNLVAQKCSVGDLVRSFVEFYSLKDRQYRGRSIEDLIFSGWRNQTPFVGVKGTDMSVPPTTSTENFVSQVMSSMGDRHIQIIGKRILNLLGK
jgi:hypothetical protein